MHKDQLLVYRKEFPILKDSVYLISNSLGAMPKKVNKYLKQYTSEWASKGVKAWEEGWWMLNNEVGNLIAPLIGAGKNQITIHTNVSLIQSIVISCLNFNKKKYKIITTDTEFPSDLYVYSLFGKALGAEVKIVKSGKALYPSTEKILNAIDNKTRLVALSHVNFKTAYKTDIKLIAEKAHKVGAIVFVDAYHSVGVMDVDVNKLGIDILTGGTLKWLCGGPGAAFLWVKPELSKILKPKITGWLAHKVPFSFQLKMNYTDTNYSFLNGTPSIPALYAAKAGPEIINKIGTKKIREKSIRQTSLIIAKALKEGYDILTPLQPELRGGTVTLNMPNAFAISKELLRRNIFIDYRENAGIRIAPHFYNTDEEIDIFFEAIREIKKNF